MFPPSPSNSEIRHPLKYSETARACPYGPGLNVGRLTALGGSCIATGSCGYLPLQAPMFRPPGSSRRRPNTRAGFLKICRTPRCRSTEPGSWR